jgi:hypothetical protein
VGKKGDLSRPTAGIAHWNLTALLRNIGCTGVLVGRYLRAAVSNGRQRRAGASAVTLLTWGCWLELDHLLRGIGAGSWWTRCVAVHRTARALRARHASAGSGSLVGRGHGVGQGLTAASLAGVGTGVGISTVCIMRSPIRTNRLAMLVNVPLARL